MVRSELVDCLSRSNPDFTSQEAERILSIFFDTIIDHLRDGGRVEIRGFGSFSTRKRDARVARNPRTGEAVEMGVTHVPWFKPGKALSERLSYGSELQQKRRVAVAR
jgi:integration host factor subunit beta